MHLYNIPRHWPPRGDANTGLMTLHGEVPNEFFISLKDLHEPAWWTGVRFLCPAGERHITFTVSIVNAAGEEVSGKSPGGTWTQKIGEWAPFNWAIPAALARTCEYQLRVRHDGPAEGQWITREVAFHEIDALDPRSNYIFVPDESNPYKYYHWNGTTHESHSDLRYALSTAVHLVPPMAYYLNIPSFYT